MYVHKTILRTYLYVPKIRQEIGKDSIKHKNRVSKHPKIICKDEDEPIRLKNLTETHIQLFEIINKFYMLT